MVLPEDIQRLGQLLAEQDYRSLSSEIVMLIEAEARRRGLLDANSSLARKRKTSRNGNGKNGSTAVKVVKST